MSIESINIPLVLLVSAAAPFILIVVWFIRLEGKVNMNTHDIMQHGDLLQKNEAMMTKVLDELRTLNGNIQWVRGCLIRENGEHASEN